MSVHVSSKPADEASRLPAAAWLVLGLRLLPRDVGDRAVSIDALGSALLAACMLGLLSGLIQGSTDGWTAAPT